jgi:carboxypeptidase family protein
MNRVATGVPTKGASMGWRVVRGFAAAVALVAVPVIASAQDATLSGAVTDAAGKPVAGVAVTATHLASGETVAAVTSANGAYRVPMRIGGYQITFAAAGFATV